MARRKITFGPFEADASAGELRKDGRKVKLQDKPFRVLEILLEHPGEAITREELVARLWPDGTFVDFDNSLNAAIKKLRTALGDSADQPRYVETVARGGYRYVGPSLGVVGDAGAVKPAARSRSWMIYSSIVGGLAIVAAIWMLAPAPASKTHGIAVLPFQVRGSEELAYLEEGMTDLLSTTLDSRSIPTVDPMAILSYIAREKPELDDEGARSVAAQLGASEYVLGSIVTAGDKMRVQAALYDESGRMQTRGSEEGRSDEVFAIVDSLTAQLLAGRIATPVALSSVTTDSLAALKLYLEGERIYREGMVPSTSMDLRFRSNARDAFIRATEEDPTFALAWARAADMVGWFGRIDPTFDYLAKALEHAGRLSQRDRARLEAQNHRFHGRYRQAESIYDDMLDQRRDDARVYQSKGELIQGNAWRSGRDPEDARQFLNRALEMDPENFDILWSVRAFATWHGPPELARELSLKLAPQGYNLTYRLASGFIENDKRVQQAAMEELPRALTNEDTRGHALMAIRMAMDPFVAFDRFASPRLSDAAIQIALHGTRDDLPLEFRAWSHAWIAALESGRGRVLHAQRELTSAASVREGTGLMYAALVALNPVAGWSEPERIELIRKLETWDGERALDVFSRLPLGTEFGAVLRLYALGHLSAMVGRDNVALEHAATLDAMVGPQFAESLPRDYAATIRAALAANAGDAAHALELLEQSEMKVLEGHLIDSSMGAHFLQSPARYLRANLLAELAREEEAINWFSTFGSNMNAIFEHPYEVASYLRRGQIYDELGHRGLAIEYYSRFLALWNEPDERGLPIVRDVAERLEQLSDDGS